MKMKTKNKNVKNKFKIGDEVKFIKHGGTILTPEYLWSKNDNLIIGNKYCIKEITRSGNIRVKDYFLSPDLFKKTKN